MHTIIKLLGVFLFTVSIYSYTVTKIDGTPVTLSQYSGKKILFVNTATSAIQRQQFARLELLRQRYPDSLVIIAVPSNSFGHEPRTNGEIQTFLQDSFDVHYVVSEKLPVTGTSAAPLYQWLTQKSSNGAFSNAVGGDFFKYLVDEQGNLLGVFAPSVDPLSTELTSVISN